jgi:hypothetical protein
MIAGYITPEALLGLVQNTVPWLELPAAESVAAVPIETRAAGPQGFRAVLAAAGTGAVDAADDDDTTLEYFALCLAAHHATVASFVPTDVDSKIRGLLWRRVTAPASLVRMWAITTEFAGWDVPAVSRRTVEVEPGRFVSGHDGERLSVFAGALGRALALDATEVADAARQAIVHELQREATVFQRLAATPGAEIPTLVLAAALTHNAGDLDQGLSFWPKSDAYRADAARVGRLAHENTTPFGGAFAQAARLYKMALAVEGHRNYPLRGVRALRQSRDLLLPVAPFLDDWGAHLAKHPALADDDLSQVLEALVSGSRKLAGQRGYYRAIAGLQSRIDGSRLERVVAAMPASVRSEFRGSELRRQVAVPRASFESMMRKMVRAEAWRKAG